MTAPNTDYIVFSNNQQAFFRKGQIHMEKLELKTELNINEGKLMQILEQQLFYDNIELTGSEANNLILQVHNYIKENDIDSTVKFELCDYCTEVGSLASKYAFQEGFKEGIRLFKTLIQI